MLALVLLSDELALVRRRCVWADDEDEATVARVKDGDDCVLVLDLVLDLGRDLGRDLGLKSRESRVGVVVGRQEGLTMTVVE